MKVTKHGFTHMDTDDTPVHLCPECQFAMHRIGTNTDTRMILDSIKLDKHYEEYRCDGCGCEGEVKRGSDNIRIRAGVIQMIVTVILSTILHILLWYWVVWYDKTYDPRSDKGAIAGIQVSLLILLASLTIVSVVNAIEKFKDDYYFHLR